MQGSFRWAWARTKSVLNSFSVGAVILAVVLDIAGYVLVAPANADGNERLIYSIGLLLVAVLIVVGGTFAAVLIRAPYRQRDALRAVTTLLRSQLKDESPDFEASIEQVMSGILDKQPMALIQVAALNRGQASFADHWKAAVVINGHSRDLPQVKLPAELHFPVGNGQVQTVLAADAIYEKTFHPIGRGDQTRGFLLVGLAGLTQPEFHQAGNRLEVSFADFTKRTYKAVQVMEAREASDQYKYYPGAATQGPRPDWRDKGKRNR